MPRLPVFPVPTKITRNQAEHCHKFFRKGACSINKSLDQLFFELFGRAPRAGEPDHPFYLAALRRFGAPADKLSPKRVAASDALLSFVRIKDQKGVVYYGGDQNWYDDPPANRNLPSIESLAGCGIVAMLNILISFCFGNEVIAQKMGLHYYYDGTIHKNDMLALMRSAYQTVGSAERPLAAARYRKKAAQPQPDPVKNKKVPPSFGIWGGRFVRGTLRLAGQYGLSVGCRTLLTQYCGYREGLDFLTGALNRGEYVDLYTTFNDHPMLLFPDGKDPFSLPPAPHKNSLHHVVVVGLIASETRPQIIVSSWGCLGVIDYNTLYESWQSGKAVASALFNVYQTGSPKDTVLARRASMSMLFRSLLRAFHPGRGKAPEPEKSTYKTPEKK